MDIRFPCYRVGTISIGSRSTLDDCKMPDPKDVVFIVELVSFMLTAMPVIQSLPPGNGNDNQTCALVIWCFLFLRSVLWLEDFWGFRPKVG
ncbi:hypothetical protein EV421DRAFT_1783468 [Armillaria borealis]|uniref:Uncharacterized protein n=1 Tax=Armillaria borealis TaxID=47425 RepID=A0AA39MWH5_9AGAR|nr:hypothetical protein EV421DRAFT_1783468 [Armillaria borealis]